MAGKIVLVTGGARSGKSTFAENYIAANGGKIAYIATSQVLDEEMRLRVKRHRDRRPSNWYTYEAPLAAHQAMEEAVQNYDGIIFDCVTLYATNLLLKACNELDESLHYQYIMDEINKLVQSAKSNNSLVVFVTNEVGMGIVPEHALSREYRDIAGLVNQKLAAAADEVYFVVCGLAVDFKRLAVNINRCNHEF